jgi:hypothetical protein
VRVSQSIGDIPPQAPEQRQTEIAAKRKRSLRGMGVTHGVRGILLPGDGIIPSLALDLVMRVILSGFRCCHLSRGARWGPDGVCRKNLIFQN